MTDTTPDEPGDATVRLSINLTPATNAAITRLARERGVSRTEAVRSLIAYGHLLATTAASGAVVLIRHPDCEVLDRVVVV